MCLIVRLGATLIRLGRNLGVSPKSQIRVCHRWSESIWGEEQCMVNFTRVVLELQPSTLAGDQKVIVVVINDNPWPKQCEK